MKANTEIIKHIEGATCTLDSIKKGMEQMTEQEIQLARQIHQQLLGIKENPLLSALPKTQASVKEMENAVNEIILQCQMHDILSQRVEHVIQTHRQLIAELNIADGTGKSGRVLPDILKLNSRQMTDVQKLWVMNVKLIADSWQLIHTSCRMLEKTLAAASVHETFSHLFGQLTHQSNTKAAPLYDELFMSSYWQQLEMQYSALSRQFQKESFSPSSNERLRTLREVEKLYTMQAERDILMRLLEESRLLSAEELMSDSNDSDDFAELF